MKLYHSDMIQITLMQSPLGCYWDQLSTMTQHLDFQQSVLLGDRYVRDQTQMYLIFLNGIRIQG